MAKELGYTGEETLEGVKQFLSNNYNIIWYNSSEKLKQYKVKCGATFKPDLSKVTAYSIYAKNEWYLVETILFKIKSGDWKLEIN
jgi:hypothetical protein